jgi:hypothetical protein
MKVSRASRALKWGKLALAPFDGVRLVGVDQVVLNGTFEVVPLVEPIDLGRFAKMVHDDVHKYIHGCVARPGFGNTLYERIELFLQSVGSAESLLNGLNIRAVFGLFQHGDLLFASSSNEPSASISFVCSATWSTTAL